MEDLEGTICENMPNKAVFAADCSRHSTDKGLQTAPKSSQAMKGLESPVPGQKAQAKRGDTIKTPKADSRLGGGDGRMTKVQEMKQFCGGTPFFGVILENLSTFNDSPHSAVVVDLLAFDAWAAGYAVGQLAKGFSPRNIGMFLGGVASAQNILSIS